MRLPEQSTVVFFSVEGDTLPYLDASQRQAVLKWLEQKNDWDLQELQAHIEDCYGVIFQPKQSYYELFHAAGISWKKTQKNNPKKNPELVEKKTRNHHLALGASSSY